MSNAPGPEMMDEPMLQFPRLARIFTATIPTNTPFKSRAPPATSASPGELPDVRRYLKARLKSFLPEDSFESRVRNRFGDGLYRTFPKTYTEKDRGIPCTEIRADWAARRIHGPGFLAAALTALRNSGKAKSLTKTFDYPAPACSGKAVRATVPISLFVKESLGLARGIRHANSRCAR